MKVTVKSIPVRYEGSRYIKGEELEINEKHFNENLFEEIEGSDDDTDLFSLTEAELKKVNKDIIQSFLDKESIEYDSSSNKDALIDIILKKE